MTTLVICDCGNLAEYDEGFALNCQHCGDKVLSPVTDGNNEEEHEYVKIFYAISMERCIKPCINGLQPE